MGERSIIEKKKEGNAESRREKRRKSSERWVSISVCKYQFLKTSMPG